MSRLRDSFTPTVKRSPPLDGEQRRNRAAFWRRVVTRALPAVVALVAIAVLLGFRDPGMLAFGSVCGVAAVWVLYALVHRWEQAPPGRRR